MAIRAYMVKTTTREKDGKKYFCKEVIPTLEIGENVILDRDDMFSFNMESDLADFLKEKGHAYLNKDNCGTLEFTQDDWEEVKEQFVNSKFEYSLKTQEYVRSIVQKYKNFFQMIDHTFKMAEADYVEFECR